MIDIPKLIGELEHAGDSWGKLNEPPSQLRSLCHRAALALRQQQESSMRETMHRLGLVLIELGRKLTGQNDG
ncbi:MAG: hypothetical protein K2X43_01085 [Hyphomonadaceae bacterium]|jgi:hypothetical protein|nr:hypothetical protein [Hyphomonadaceae bacterium]